MEWHADSWKKINWEAISCSTCAISSNINRTAEQHAFHTLILYWFLCYFFTVHSWCHFAVWHPVEQVAQVAQLVSGVLQVCCACTDVWKVRSRGGKGTPLL